MIARLRLLVLIAVTIVAVPAFAHGQKTDATSTSPSAGPRLDATATAARPLVQSSLDNLITMQRRARESQSVALMIVGGAAVLLGAVIGDDAGTLFMLGGAVAFLIGLYRYLQ